MSQRFIVGVAGGSGSGKTTIVGMLQQHHGPEGLLVVNMDHYYKDLSHLSPEERDRRNFDHPDALDWDLLVEQVGELAAGRGVDRPTYDFASHTRQGTVPLAPAPALVVDGILSLHDPRLRSLYTLSVYVEVDDDLRFIRRMQRDVAERGRTPEGVVAQYLESVKPMHELFVEPQRQTADVILGWKERSENAVRMLARAIS